MDDNTPQFKPTTKKNNRRRNIFLAVVLLLALIVAVVVVLYLCRNCAQADTPLDETGITSKNASAWTTHNESQRGIGSGTAGNFLNSTLQTTDATTDAESTQTPTTSDASLHADSTQRASTYISKPTEHDGNTGQQQSILHDSSPTVDTPLVPHGSNTTDRLKVTHTTNRRPTSKSSGRPKKTDQSKHNPLAKWHSTNTSYSYKVYKELKSFEEAKKTCQSVNSVLASTGVRNGNAKSKIVNIISNIRATVKGVKPYVWIGMRVNSTNGTDWQWSDGHVQQEDTIEFWGADQPDRIKRGTIEMCVAISTKLDPIKKETGLLHDCPCGKPLPFICEKKKFPKTEA